MANEEAMKSLKYIYMGYMADNQELISDEVARLEQTLRCEGYATLKDDIIDLFNALNVTCLTELNKVLPKLEERIALGLSETLNSPV